MDHCLQRIQDAFDYIEDYRILEEDAMAKKAGKVSDGDINAFQIPLNMRAHSEA